ncbi:MAG: hypothetical protein SNI51_08420 [Rikenellaceae bacterium]
MENNFELEEMKQQWSTLQTALNSQKEVNIKLILSDAKKRVSWNKAYLRTIFFLTLLIVLPVVLCVMTLVNIPQPIFVTTIALLTALALAVLYLSFIIKSPRDGNLDILKYSKSLVKFKKVYLWSTIFAWLVVIAIIIGVITSIQIDITNGKSISVIIGGVIGAIIGISLDVKMLSNIKELQNDIDLIDKLHE